MPTKPPRKSAAAIELHRKQEAEAAAEALIAKAERAAKALDMRRKGKNLWTIAEELNMSPGEVQRLTVEHLREAAELIATASKQEQLALEVERLDEMQAAVYPAALAGDVSAVRAVLTIIDDRAELLQLKAMDPMSTLQTLVAMGDPAGYRLALEQAARNAITTVTVERDDEQTDEYAYPEDLPAV